MALINVNLTCEEEYKNLIKDIYKIIVILCILQTLFYNYDNKNLLSNSMNGKLLNDDLLVLILFLIISFAGYYFVFERFLQFY